MSFLSKRPKLVMSTESQKFEQEYKELYEEYEGLYALMEKKMNELEALRENQSIGDFASLAAEHDPRIASPGGFISVGRWTKHPRSASVVIEILFHTPEDGYDGVCMAYPAHVVFSRDRTTISAFFESLRKEK